MTFVSSGRAPAITDDGKTVEILNTTSPDQIAFELNLSKTFNRDHVLFSTYRSFNRCIEGVKAVRDDNTRIFVIFDEAHYLSHEVEDNNAFETLRDNLDIFTERFFFTATPRYSRLESDETSGMNNPVIYGDVICEVKPIELIKAGIICPPRLHNVYFPYDIDEDNLSTVAGDFIIKSFIEHENVIRKHCNDAEVAKLLGGKLLVAGKGSKQARELLDNGFTGIANENGITVFVTMSHPDVGCCIHYADGTKKEKISKEQWQEEFRDYCGKMENRAIIFHYNQLTSGIDVPSLTGLIVLRGMLLDRSIQNIGRTLRVLSQDRGRTENEMIKPYAWIIVPNIEAAGELKSLIPVLREDFGYDSVIYGDLDKPTGCDDWERVLQHLEKKDRAFRKINGELRHELEELDNRVTENIISGEQIEMEI
jgi:superfamily II DNA or RNA helicase